MEVFEKARSFVYRNARPLELAIFQYHFENGSKEDVLKALSFYQNSDGGFGHALEADCHNPDSSPIQSNTACDILHGIGFEDSNSPIIKGLLSFYDSGAHFDGKCWATCIESNELHPHASWWSIHNKHWHNAYNPTAQIAGFIVRHAKHDSELYNLGVRIVREAADALLRMESLDMGVGSCYIQMREYLEAANATDLIPYYAFKAKLHELVCALINTDKATWDTYTCKPSQFIRSKDSEFYDANKEIAEYECNYIIETQRIDGSWDIPWKWDEYPEEWTVSRNWWKSNIIIQNLLYLRGFGRI